jgi:hypothetical protein
LTGPLFNKASRVVRDAKALLSLGGDGAATQTEQHEAQPRRKAKKNRQRKLELRTRLKSKRQELSQISKELRAAKRGSERSEQIEQTKRAKKKKQEIFRLKSQLRAAKRGSESELGALPDFAVIGGAKCGTTFFYHLLTKHPLVEPAAFKEPHYFDLLFDEGIEWYRQCFPKPKSKNGRRTITGEGTPGYLFNPLVPERMAEVVPQARLIALLRNPVDRTYSAYHHRARNREQGQTFEETVEACLDGPSPGFLSLGIYVDHLLRWSEFFPREQMLVLKSEDFFEHPRETMKLVLHFLDLPDWEPEASELRDRVNKGGYKQRMDPAIRRRLEEYFEPHNQRLYEYLGLDFGWR